MKNGKLAAAIGHAVAAICLSVLASTGASYAQSDETGSYAGGRNRADALGYQDLSASFLGAGAQQQQFAADGARSNGNWLNPDESALSGMQGQNANRSLGQDPWRLGSAQRRPQQQARQLSKFQQFVYRSTGRALPIYGKKLFEPPQVAYVPDAGAPVAEDYVLGPGDQVQVRVWGSVNYEGNLTLDRNGQVNIPRAGVVSLAGVRVKDVENAIRAQVGKTFTNFNLNATPGHLNGIQVYVVGHAEQPGSYTVSSASTLINALFISGGPSADGSMRNVQLRRGDKVVATLDLYDFIGKGVSSDDPQVLPGDVIVIPPVGPQVAITGALDSAAIYELKPEADGSSSLGDILALGGGVPTLAATDKALLERVANDESAPRQVQNIALDDAGLQTVLRDGDIVTLMNISPQFANAVTLQGNVASPGRYQWVPGMRIRDLIPERDALITPDYFRRKNGLVREIENDPAYQAYNDRSSGIDDSGREQPAMPYGAAQARPAPSQSQQDLGRQQSAPGAGLSGYRNGNSNGGIANTEVLAPDKELPTSKDAGRSLALRVRSMVDQINWDYAVIERLDRDRLQTQLIPFNLGRAVLDNDETQNLPLEPGDVVTILSQNDLRLPEQKRTRLVQIEGEVAAPGIYEAQPGETLQQLIERVGGLTPQAYLFGTEVDRVSVRERQQENLDMLIRRMEQQQQSQILFLLANRDSSRDAAGQAALIQQQQQLAHAQLQSLKKLRSKGRIALELDPKHSELAALPELTLEDGDHVFVPPTPGFVSVVGAVNNENVFIYKPSRTVGEVARVAGLREEADVDQMFVLRADGSIVSRRDRSGLFQSFGGMKLMPGDTLVVPEKLDRETTRNFVARQLKDWTQILSQFGLGVAAIKVIRDL